MNERILVVDDEEGILAFLSSLLESEGYEIVTATDGIEGIDRFISEKPDLVITDIKMPRKGGLEVLKEIKESGSNVDVIILTGHSNEATAIECLHQGAYDYLVKPLEDIDLLFAAIERALDKRKLDLKNKQLIKQLDELSIRDPLTGLYNFRCLHASLDEELIRSERYKHAFCILMLDIDSFKVINDTYGPRFGDFVLTKLSTLTNQTIRATDRLYRYGGEEFCIITPESSEHEAESVANRIVDTIRNHEFKYDGIRAKITVSIGGAVYPKQSNDKTGLIKCADRALYQAKEMGKNRVLFSKACS